MKTAKLIDNSDSTNRRIYRKIKHIRVFLMIALGFGTALSSGCGFNGANLFNDARYEKAVLASTQVSELSLDGVFDDIEKKQAAILEQELELSQLKISGQYDLDFMGALDVALSSPEGGLVSLLDTRISMLVGDKANNDDVLKKLAIIPKLMQKRQTDSSLSRAVFLSKYSHHFKDCTEVLAANINDSEDSPELSRALKSQKIKDSLQDAQAAYSDLFSSCIGERDLHKEIIVDAVKGSLIHEWWGTGQKITSQRLEFEQRILSAKSELIAASADLKQATPEKLKSNVGLLESEVKKIQNKINELGTELPELIGISQTKLTELERVLEGLAGTKLDASANLSEDTLKSIYVIRTIPALIDSNQESLTNVETLRLPPLEAAVGQQRLVLDSLELDRSALEDEENAYMGIITSGIDELIHLAEVKSEIQSHPEWLDVSPNALRSSLQEPMKSKLMNTMSRYLDEARSERLYQESELQKIRQISRNKRRVLSRNVAEQYEGLLTLLATVLEDHENNKLRPGILAEFWNSVGLFAIAIGVAL